MGALLEDVSINHQLRDDWWEEQTSRADRGARSHVSGVRWENVPLHLPSTFGLWRPSISPRRCVLECWALAV